ncbi:MAG: mandelate racemase [Planctomycetota bacterium]
MQIRTVAAAFAELACTARTPFRFGTTTIHSAPLLHVRVRVESVDGRSAVGAAADLLVPKWFVKDPDRTAEQDQAALRQSAEDAARHCLQHDSARSVFACSLAMHRDLVSNHAPAATDLLLRGFGPALLERALLDATCRLANKSFWSALQCDLFGTRLEGLLPSLRDVDARSVLPERVQTSILLRHTVGMLDPLRETDVVAETADGEPRSVEGYLRAHRPRWLKVKVGQGLEPDRERLLALAGLCAELGVEPGITLDGNEQFASMADVAELLDGVAEDPRGRVFLSRLAHVEQPLPRSITFEEAANRAIDRVRAYAPVVLDEADDVPSSFVRALALGYRGCSIKNCKGVFRGLANAALARAHGDGAFVCAEDLTNLPLLSLQQDLATMTTLGLAHVERNGHHYFRGLDHLPAAVAKIAAVHHDDLYETRADGGVCLRHHDGRIECGSLLGRGYGCASEPFEALMAELPFLPLE